MHDLRGRKFLRFATASILELLVLLSLCGSVWALPDKPTLSHAGLIFCPLQKKWVSPEPPSADPGILLTLSELCGPKQNKLRFLRALRDRPVSLVSTVLPRAEKLFFRYLREGDQAFQSSMEPPKLPGGQRLTASRSQIGGIGSDTTLLLAEVRTLVDGQPRPPTFVGAKDDRYSRDVSRYSSPRAPPAAR